MSEEKNYTELENEDDGLLKGASEKTALEKETAIQGEIDAVNAEDAEDEGNLRRHVIPMPDYHAMDLEQLAKELQKLINTEKVQAIKKHVEQIKHEFELKYQHLLEEKKEDFLVEGGNEIDFKYIPPVKTLYNKAYNAYKEKRDAHYKDLEYALQANLAKRMELIEGLKSLVSANEDINTSYRKFKDLQEQWRKAGPIPKNHYNDVWRTFQHHTEIFYDFLDLNRELRDVDFKRNLEEKEKIIERAQQLLTEKDPLKAFTELQRLHKIWKEDIGPVDKEHRQTAWKRFIELTKAIHHRRQEYFKNIEQVYEQNLVKKQELIQEMERITSQPITSHHQWQSKMREMERLQKLFFDAGKIPHGQNEATWTSFKRVVKTFNHAKNEFYKTLKKEQLQNLQKKQALVAMAQSLKDSEDWEQATPVLKRIQAEWKTIGQVPKKYSDKIWEDFKAACNGYFNRLHVVSDKASQEQHEGLERKKALLDELQIFTTGSHTTVDATTLKTFLEKWKVLSTKLPLARALDREFYKTIDRLFDGLGLNRQEIELMKYSYKLENMAKSPSLLEQERLFIERKINELRTEIRQLENNLQFISNANKDNPIVKEVLKNIDTHKETLAIWTAKLREVRGI